MMDVRVKTKSVRFTIPVPYAALHLGAAVISSQTFNRLINKWTKPHLEANKIHFAIPVIDKSALKSVLKELKKHKGTEIVNVIAKDGNEVRIRL
ncbi:hypothetical protein [Peribacillus sp. SCS-155]|uniref:hypothetical protein n=1 Tax=Peribacillus sedimenti TaxID=3115297 RepID=UPI00390598A5